MRVYLEPTRSRTTSTAPPGTLARQPARSRRNVAHSVRAAHRPLSRPGSGALGRARHDRSRDTPGPAFLTGFGSRREPPEIGAGKPTRSRHRTSPQPKACANTLRIEERAPTARSDRASPTRRRSRVSDTTTNRASPTRPDADRDVRDGGAEKTVRNPDSTSRTREL